VTRFLLGIAVSSVVLAVCASASTFTVINTADSGPGSLRQAITDANAGGGTVAFNIPVAPRTITLSSPLPLAGASVIIDGATQPGYAGAPMVEISGASIPSGGSQGCVRTSGTVRGIAVNRCFYADIEGVGAPVIAANYIGLNLMGGFAPPNRFGVLLAPGSSGAVIGGSSFADGNVITETSVGVRGDSVSNVLISHNKMGTDPTGAPYVGNLNGIQLSDGSNVNITFNVISGFHGIDVAFSSNVTIKNNTITRAINTDLVVGIELLFGTSNVTIGDVAGGGNTITSNSSGVVVVSGTNNAIRGNSISPRFGGLAIDLSPTFPPDGQTPNDSGDADAGPNNLQNYPVVTQVTASGGATIIAGTLNSAAGQSFTIDFYWDNAPCNGPAQAKNYLGSLAVTTDGAGNAAINTSFPTALPSGASLTATATDSGGNTSETAPCALVQVSIPTFSTDALLALIVAIVAISMLRLR
jgi:hypothetical protein